MVIYMVMVIWLYGYIVIWLYGYIDMVIWIFRSDLTSFQSARQSVELLSVLASAIYLFKWCVLQCFTQIQYCHYNLKTGRYKHRKGPKRTEKGRTY